MHSPIVGAAPASIAAMVLQASRTRLGAQNGDSCNTCRASLSRDARLVCASHHMTPAEMGRVWADESVGT